MSEDFVTAIAEYEQDLGIRPGTLCAYEVESDRIVDEPIFIREPRSDPTTPRFTPSGNSSSSSKSANRRAGRLPSKLIAEGAHGLRAPSIQTNGLDAILWRWNTDGGARVSALDPLRDLPSNQSSWR